MIRGLESIKARIQDQLAYVPYDLAAAMVGDAWTALEETRLAVLRHDFVKVRARAREAYFLLEQARVK